MVRLLAKLVSWLSRETPNLDRRVDQFITIGPNGRARFDVAAYLATEEGLALLNRHIR